MKEEKHDHKFVHIRTENYKRTISRYQWEFVSIDYYFCEKCLEEKEVKKHHSCGDYQLNLIPDWAKVITNKIAGHE